jgi:hypothetical protein
MWRSLDEARARGRANSKGGNAPPGVGYVDRGTPTGRPFTEEEQRLLLACIAAGRRQDWETGQLFRLAARETGRYVYECREEWHRLRTSGGEEAGDGNG